MNKGFFVVFLGIILGAMALIFLNQTSKPTGDAAGSYQTASRETERGATPSSQGGEPVVVASNDRPSPQRPAPASVKPGVPAPEASRPEPPKPAAPVAEAPKLQPAKPETAQPVAPAPETSKPGTPEPAVSTPVPVKPETPTSPAPKPETPQVQAPKPETPKPETPKPEPAKPEPQAPAMTPVTSTPETPAKPGAQTLKALTLVNIGLHFKGNGMALRIEADGPFSYKTFALAGPDRYVVDLVGTWNKMRAPTVPSNNMIKGARSGPQASGPRLVLDMQRAPKKHNVTWISPTVLEIVIE